MEDQEPVHLHHIPGLLKQIMGYVYNTDELIGSGSFSVVYKGYDSRTNSPVAIKVIDRRSITNEIDDMLLHNEVECHKIISHDCIIKTLDLCKTINNIYLVCEFCESGDLFTYVKNRGRIPEDEALRLISQVIRAVNHIHCKGILHRDIKSANILISNGGRLKLADFGFAEFIGYDFAKGMYSVGSPIYMAPEAFAESEYSFKSDTWSIGIILYEMLIGEQPFNGIEFEYFLYLFVSGEVYRPVAHCSPFIKNLLQRMLCMNPYQRIDTFELMRMLNLQNPEPNVPPPIATRMPVLPGIPGLPGMPAMAGMPGASGLPMLPPGAPALLPPQALPMSPFVQPALPAILPGAPYPSLQPMLLPVNTQMPARPIQRQAVFF